METRQEPPAAPGPAGVPSEPPPLDETRRAFRTLEFWAFIALLAGLVIAGAVLEGLDPGRVWLYLTILSAGYMVSRGIAKSQRGQGPGRETRASYKTTEFWILIVSLVGLAIAGAVSDGQPGGEDNLEHTRVWLYATILGVAYMVSRGLAKSGAGARANGRREAVSHEEITEARRADVDRSASGPSGREFRGPEVSAPEGVGAEDRQSALSAQGERHESLQQPSDGAGSGSGLSHAGAPAPADPPRGSGHPERGTEAGRSPRAEGRRTSASLANTAIALGGVGLVALVVTLGALFFVALPLGLAAIVFAGLASRRRERPPGARVRVAWILAVLTSLLSTVVLALVVLGIAVIRQLI